MPSVRQILKETDPAAANVWVPVPDEGLVRITRVYDGDTYHGVCCVKGTLYRITMRLKGIDCPELRGRGAEEKRAGEAVRDVVAYFCQDVICLAAPHGTDKYGRLLVDLQIPSGQDLCELLLSENLGHAYGGATRDAFTGEEIAAITRRAQEMTFAARSAAACS